MNTRFFAYLNRMKYIERWGLMHSTRKENISEHSQNTTVIAHALAIIENEIFGGSVDEYKTLFYAVYHETSEVLTGDLPTPIKYFNAEIRDAYKDLESHANQKLLSMLPETLSSRYAAFLNADTNSEEWLLVKAADTVSAYVKCLEELSFGNGEFKSAENSIREKIEEIDHRAVRWFVENCLSAYKMTLDELE